MKKIKTILLFSVLAVVLVFGGCSNRDNTNDATGTEAPNDNSMMEDMATEAGEIKDDIVGGANAVIDGANDMMNTDSTDDIGEEKAKEVALNHASKDANKVQFTKVEKGSEDGKMVYDIEFREGNTEYEYEIDAASGAIRQSESDKID